MTAPKTTQGGPRARVRPAPSAGRTEAGPDGTPGPASPQTAGGGSGSPPPVPDASGPPSGLGEGAGGPLVITVIGKPAPQGSKRHVGGGRLIEQSTRVKPWREAVKQAALDATRALLAYPAGDGPITVEIGFCFEPPKSAPKKRRVWPITRSSGDIDKLLRAAFDALTDAAVWRDDSQVVRVYADKFHTNDPAAPLAIPGAVIAIYPMENQ